jgi:hypothetical protein
VSSTSWHARRELIVRDAMQMRVLALWGTNGWRLPRLEWEHYPGVSEPEPIHVRRFAHDELGLDATILRRVHGMHDDRQRTTSVLLELEQQDPTWRPRETARWMSRADLHGLDLADDRYREPLDSALREAEHDEVPRLRPPWEQRGWMARARTWIEEQLSARDFEAIGLPEQVRSTCISSVLRIDCRERGHVYFKASPAPGASLPPADPDSAYNSSIRFLFSNEARVTNTLAQRLGALPVPIAVDEPRGWMLLPDLGPAMERLAPLDEWESATRELARLQVASIEAADELQAGGCLDRRLPQLMGEIEPLLKDGLRLALLEPEEAHQLRTSGPRLRMLCEQLASYGLPATLLHGDFHPGNVARGAGRPVVFDWTDACLAHPFLDLVTIVVAAARHPDP